MQTSTGLAYLIKCVLDEQIAESVFANSDFLRLFTRLPGPGAGGTWPGRYYEINARTVANTGIEIDEAATIEAAGTYPASVASAFDRAVFPYLVAQGSFGYTDEAKRALGQGAANSYHPGLNVEAEDCLRVLFDLVETTFMADTAVGLLGLVDDDSTDWGGIVRTGLNLESYVVAGGTARISDALLSNLFRGVRDSDHGGSPEVVIGSHTQERLYGVHVVGQPYLNDPRVGDASFAGYNYKGVPFVPIQDFPADEVVALSGVTTGRSIGWADHNSWDTSFFDDDAVVEFRQVPFGAGKVSSNSTTVGLVKLAKTAPESSYVWTISGALILKQPWEQGKIENLAVV